MFMADLSELQSYIEAHGVKYFRADEVCWLPRLQKHVVPDEELWGNSIPTLKLCDAIREAWGAPVHVLSGYRPMAYNRAVGGANSSQHLQFRAFDLKPANGKVAEFRRLVQRIVLQWRAEGNQVGLGLYPSFCHIDVGYKTRSWAG
jgi:hypothetical protein